MPPPNADALARLQAADNGAYGQSQCLQAIMDAGGDENQALAILRGGGGAVDSTPSNLQATPTPVQVTAVSVVQPTPSAVQATPSDPYTKGPVVTLGAHTTVSKGKGGAGY